uniref:Uncharacterized protein n=1 Tax=Anopheles albimanus TaxID=7167 RepID=A0A182FEU2_ANOAL
MLRMPPSAYSCLAQSTMPLYFWGELPPCWICSRHLIRSPGAITVVVKTPEIAPATNSCVLESSSSGVCCCNRFPMPKPKKLTAKIGATPVIGADMPLYSPRKPSRAIVFLAQSSVPAYSGAWPAGGIGIVCSRTLIVSSGQQCAPAALLPAILSRLEAFLTWPDEVGHYGSARVLSSSSTSFDGEK